MKTERKKTGFTIVELLTVMSVIALLIGLLVPALSMVRKIAKDTRQRAQFHSISAALETFAGEMDEYPNSTIQPSDNGEPNTAPYTVGAQHLTEALIGRDFLGLDPWTTWDAENDKDRSIYGTGSETEKEASLDRRKGPYLNPEGVEAYQIGQLYKDTGNVYDIEANAPAPVLTDSYRVKTITLSNNKQIKAGTPILYYKANVRSKIFYNSSGGVDITDAEAAASIFNSLDNEELIALCTVMDETNKHHFDPAYTSGSITGRELFYDAITNPKITTLIRPYNQTSYILISAGFDGVFGTPDDIFNFSE